MIRAKSLSHSLVMAVRLTVLIGGLGAMPVGYAAASTPLVTNLYAIDSEDAREMTRLQSLLKGETPFPIVVLNRQALQLNLAVQKHRHPGTAEDQLKSEIVQAEVKRQIGFSLHPAFGESYYNEIENNLELGMIHGFDYSRFSMTGDTSGKFCMLYPGRRDLDNDRLTRFITDFRPESYQSLAQFKMTPILTRREHIRLSDFHEFSHCIDDHYFVEYLEGRVKGSSAYFENRARIELKAEVLGILLMTKYEGATDLARRRSQERYLDSWFRGRNVAAMSSDEVSRYSGATYAFGPALEYLQGKIDQVGLGEIRQYGTRQLVEFAEQVVEAAVLNFAQMTALTDAYHQPQRALAQSAQAEFLKNYLDKVAEAFLAITQSAAPKNQILTAIISNQSVAGDPLISFPEIDQMSELELQNARGHVLAQFKGLKEADQFIRQFGRIENQLAQTLESAEEIERLQAMRQYRALPQAFADALARLH